VRPITVGPASGGDTSIESGLSAGETVVVDGVDKLRAGSTVEVRTTGHNAAEKPGA
jgi:membrane fusion protein, multidrug efflux system